jgi:hypothetical protein
MSDINPGDAGEQQEVHAVLRGREVASTGLAEMGFQNE